MWGEKLDEIGPERFEKMSMDPLDVYNFDSGCPGVSTYLFTVKL